MLMMCGCRASVESHGRDRGISAAYQFRTLEAELDRSVSTLTVQAAAEQTLRARGYVITGASRTAEMTRITAQTGGADSTDRIVVETWPKGRATGLSITCEPWGDEAQSRMVLDAVLARLGR
jgi:hypothetical protein